MSVLASDKIRARSLLLLGIGVVVLLGGTTLLWAHYGTAVFFEIVRTGWTSCF